MTCVRTTLSKVMLKELVFRNRTDLQHILWTARINVSIITRGTRCYIWPLKRPSILGWVASSIHPPRIILSYLLKTRRIFQKVPHTIFKTIFLSVTDQAYCSLSLRCTIDSNTIFIHWTCREFPFCFMTSSINFHFSPDNTDDFSGRE